MMIDFRFRSIDADDYPAHMSDRELSGRELENYWRERLETAFARYQRSLSPDPAAGTEAAMREQARALEEYAYILKRFTEIVIQGAYPIRGCD